MFSFTPLHQLSKSEGHKVETIYMIKININMYHIKVDLHLMYACDT